MTRPQSADERTPAGREGRRGLTAFWRQTRGVEYTGLYGSHQKARRSGRLPILWASRIVGAAVWLRRTEEAGDHGPGGQGLHGSSTACVREMDVGVAAEWIPEQGTESHCGRRLSAWGGGSCHPTGLLQSRCIEEGREVHLPPAWALGPGVCFQDAVRKNM